MTLLRGRGFQPADRDGAPPVAVVNEAFARHFFGDADPIGRRFGYSEDRLDREIVGVVADARVDGLRSEVPPQVFYPHTQYPQSFLRHLLVRVDGDPGALRPAVSHALAEVDTRLAVREIVPLDELTGRTVARDRLLSRLTSAFALIAVGVACLGLFGSVSYSVSRRTREIGVRVALGSDGLRVVWAMLSRTLWQVAVGVAAGGTVAAGVLYAFLVGVRHATSVAFAHVAVFLAYLGIMVAVCRLATLVPVTRAHRIEPTEALKAD
jgi:putative ABC transport system permease protein